MPTHATDWKKAQCKPMELTKANAIRSLGRRENTLHHKAHKASVNSRAWERRRPAGEETEWWSGGLWKIARQHLRRSRS